MAGELNLSPRIAVTGSHGTGKTTLVRSVAGALGLPVVREASRVVASNLGLTDLLAQLDDVDALMRFQWACLDYQSRAEEDHAGTGFVTDRGWADHLAYPLALGGIARKASDDDGFVETVIRRGRVAYDLVVVTPITGPPTRDGFRSTLTDYQWAADRAIRAVLPDVHSGTRILHVQGTLRDRLRQVLKEVYK